MFSSRQCFVECSIKTRERGVFQCLFNCQSQQTKIDRRSSINENRCFQSFSFSCSMEFRLIVRISFPFVFVKCRREAARLIRLINVRRGSTKFFRCAQKLNYRSVCFSCLRSARTRARQRASSLLGSSLRT